MRIHLFAVGKLKSGPESELTKRYLDRLSKSGPAIGLEFSKMTEVSESRASHANTRKSDEGALLDKAIPDNAKLIILDEVGETISSDKFAKLLANLRDNGDRDVIFAIGGADLLKKVPIACISSVINVMTESFVAVARDNYLKVFWV